MVAWPLLLIHTSGLSPLPPGLNEFSRVSGRAGSLTGIRKAVATAAGRAIADDKELLEVEFPPLLETKTQVLTSNHRITHTLSILVCKHPIAV